MDQSRYATIPDNKLTLTENGIRQAYVSVPVPPQSLPLSFTPLPLSQAAGIELKKLVGEESVTFYVSPFTRSRQTYEQIQQFFPDEQVRFDGMCRQSSSS